jgi:HK97 family phage major capsid protein
MDRTVQDLTQRYESNLRARSYIAKAVGESLYGVDWERHVAAVAGTTFIADLQRRAAVPAGSTLDGAYVGPLVDPRFSGSILELVRPKTVIDQLVGVLRFPPNTLIATQTLTAVPTFEWEGEFRSVPVAAHSYASFLFPLTKISGISVINSEAARAPDTQGIIERPLIAGLARGCNEGLLNPALTAVTGLRPASLTNGVTPIMSSGNDAESIEADVAAAFGELSGGAPERPYVVASQSVLLQLLRLRSTGGEKVFPNLSILGGELWGSRVLVSESAANHLILIDAPGIAVAELGIEIESTTQAALQMVDNPSDGPTDLVSLFQVGAVAIKATRWISWTKREDAVSLVDLGFGSPS